MKRVNLFIMAAFIAASAMFVGCTSDPSDAPSIKVYFKVGSGAEAESTDLKVEAFENETVTVKFEFSAPGGIKTIDIKQVGGTSIPGGYPKTSGFTNANLAIETFTVTASAPGKVEYIGEVTDKDKEPQSRNKKVEITFLELPPLFGDIKTWPNKSLGSLSHDGTAGSSCASIDGSVYVIAEARTNAAKVDFIFWNGTSNPNSIAAPNNATVKTLGAMSTAWSKYNNTKLKKLTTVTTAQFDDLEDDGLIEERVTTATVDTDIVSSLAQNDIIGFITENGKKGFIKVNSVGSPANHINITIKVQE